MRHHLNYVAISLAGFLWFLALHRSVMGSQGEKADKALNHVAEVWRNQQNEIRTAHIRYRLVRGVSGLSPLSPAQVEELVERDAGLPPEELFTRLCDQLRPGVIPRLCELITDGTRFREAELSGKGKRVHLFDGENHVVSQMDGRQVDLHDRDKKLPQGESLEDFRWIPQQLHGLESCVVVEREGDVVTYQTRADGGSRARINLRTGDLLLARSSFGDTGVRRLQYQLGWRLFPKEVRMPAISMLAEFRRGKLSFLRLSLLEQATFNAELPQDAFVMSAGEGTNLFDYRSSHGGVLAGMPGAKDAKVFANEVFPSTSPMPSSRRRNVRGILLGTLIVLTLVVVALVIYRNYRVRRA